MLQQQVDIKKACLSNTKEGLNNAILTWFNAPSLARGNSELIRVSLSKLSIKYSFEFIAMEARSDASTILFWRQL
jgi:hypothetical protein